MTAVPVRCVVDTNVATTANGANPGAPPDCVAASAQALQAVMAHGHVCIDDANRIVAEYRNNLSAGGQPGPGDAFFKWLLTNEWGGTRVTRVRITSKEDDPEDFEELPDPDDGTVYDRSDRKFLAVAVADPARPPILQAFDSKWWGWQDDMPSALAKTDIFCLPSYREGVPNALLEACACGLPIVTTDVPGCRDVVTNKFNGLLVPVQNAPALADALETLITDPELRLKMGKAGREIAVNKFSQTKVNAETLAVYNLLKPPPRA